MFIRIVQICSLATAGIGQPLLTFCSHPEQSWIFALIVAVLKIPYIHCFASVLPRPYMMNLKRIIQ